MLVCIEVKSDSGSGLIYEADRMKHFIEGYIPGATVNRLIVTDEEYELFYGLSMGLLRGLGVEQNDPYELTTLYGVPLVRTLHYGATLREAYNGIPNKEKQ